MPVEHDDHAKLSPSSSSRWLRCPGSVAAIEGLPDVSGRPAAEGTIYHHRIEEMIEKGASAEGFIDAVYEENGYNIVVDPSMVEALVDGYAALTDILGGDPHELYLMGDLQSELRVNLESFLGPDQFGTSDIVFFGGKRLVVLDWKYGRIVVDPVDNSQLAIYGIGSYNSLLKEHQDQIETVEIYVYQPRDTQQPLKLWGTTPEHLKKLEKEYRAAAIATKQDNAARIAGEKQCIYCAAKPDCFAHAEWVFGQNPFEPIMDDEPETLDIGTMIAVYEKSGLIRSYLNAVKDRLTGLAEKGQVPGYALEEGRKGNRTYSDPELAQDLLEDMLGEDAYITRLRTPAQAAERLGNDFINEITYRPDGAQTLKPIEEN